MATYFNTYPTKFVTTSGTGVLAATGKPVYLQAMYNGQLSAQTVAIYSGTTTVTMAIVTMATKTYLTYPMDGPGGLTYQTIGNPGDGELRLTFFYTPGTST